jgi:hypothetical protein
MSVSAWCKATVGLLWTVVLMGAASSVNAQAAETQAARLLAAARKAIHAGSATDAMQSLEMLKKLFPQTPEADQGEKLLTQISSLEVLMDCSHEWRGDVQTVASYLKQSGIGVTISDASLDHMKDRLADYEVVLVWQETASLSFTDPEIQMLKEYVNKGGRLLVIGTTQTLAPYPVRKVLDALSCPLRSPQTQASYGDGKVKFFDNTGLFKQPRLGDARESQEEVVEVFQRLMPYEAVNRSKVDDYVKPEETEEAGPIRIEASWRLRPSADRTKELLGKVLEQVRVTYKDELAEGMTVRLLPRAWSGWAGGMVFSSGAFEGLPEQARQLSKAVALYGLFPEGKWISYPPWITNGWCDLVGLRTCFKVGFKLEAEAMRKELMDAYKPNPAKPDGIDLSVSAAGESRPYIGKAQWVLETVETNHSKETLAQLRRTLKRYAAAGKMPESISTRNMIFYLSQALGRDLFGFFQAIGTSVIAVPLDYHELEKPEKK